MAVIKILKSFRNVAMVGVSANPEKPSNIVFRYLTTHGYNVIPVNPTIKEVEGKKCYANLSAIPEKVEVVDIFRRSEDIPPIVDEAIKIGAKAVWMQEGIINDAAAEKANSAGLLVVMDKCMRKEHIRLSEEGQNGNLPW
jgi:predicted CoA-binding protein